MERIDLREVPRNLADIVHLVHGSKARLVVHDANGPIGSFVSLADLELLEHVAGDPKRLPARRDLADLRKALGGAHARDAFAQRGILLRDGEEAIALVPLADVEALEGIDTQLDLEVARRMLEDALRERDGEGD
ncbi:MAG: hypothetical protein IPM29_07575 [Planctomycetes bacterium]|nr:hypothetical protein [Planctomycetota bacterium]